MVLNNNLQQYKSTKLKLFLLIFFFISQYLLATVGFAGISIRIYVLMGLMIYALFVNGLKKINICFKYYIVYLLFYICICAINGDMFTADFSKNMLSYHILSIATYLVYVCIIRNEKELNLLLVLIIILCLFNSFVTILQFHNIPIGWSIGNFFGVDSESAELYLDAHGNDSFLNAAFSAGINGNAVVNGYFMASFFPVMIYGIWSKSIWKRMISYFCTIVGLYTIFCIQQRMALICVALYLIYVFYYKVSTSKISLFIALLALLFLYLWGFSSENYDFGRLSSQTDNSARLTLIDGLFVFFQNGDVLFGGFEKYLSLGFQGQHNTFFDVVTRAGLIGLVVFIIYFFKTLIFVKDHINIRKPSLQTSLCFSVIIYILYSQTHSTGIQSGITFYWSIIAMIDLCSIYKSKVTVQNSLYK